MMLKSSKVLGLSRGLFLGKFCSTKAAMGQIAKPKMNDEASLEYIKNPQSAALYFHHLQYVSRKVGLNELFFK